MVVKVNSGSGDHCDEEGRRDGENHAKNGGIWA